MKLFVFNPWHEEALAADSAYYTPTRAAQQTEQRERGIMRQWMGKDDLLLDEDVKQPRWEDIEKIVPWGWDKLLRHRLLRLGAPEHLLPTYASLEKLRFLSSRATTSRLLPLLRAEVPGTIGRSRLCHTEKQVLNTLNEWGGAMLKAPWSCAGRGVFLSSCPPDEKTRLRIRNVLRKQGFLEAQQYICAARDFAMEFFYDGNCLHYLGLSLFSTTSQGTYAGNKKGTEAELRALLLDKSTDTIYHNICRALQKHLPTLLGTDYAGPLGVDMLLADRKIHPCVELNLRLTMGTPPFSPYIINW